MIETASPLAVSNRNPTLVKRQLKRGIVAEMLRAIRDRADEPVAAKVPEITLMFWVLKILTTGTGEAISDFLSHKSIPLDVVVGFFGFVLALGWQLVQRRYRAAVYWLAVMMVAVFGTIAADAVHKGAGIPYAVSTVGFAVAVAVLFTLWHRSEGTLSIHSITIVAFWIAYVVTRPLGASIADWVGKPSSLTGLGVGDGTVSGLAILVFVGLVAYVAVSRRDIQAEPATGPA